MALIKCEDCGADVSDSAPVCPKCGRPISLATNVIKTLPPAQKKTGVSAGFALLVFLALGGWIYYQATTSSESPVPNTSQASSEPAQGTGSAEDSDSQASAGQEKPTFVTTPANLYQAYSANEVAVDQALAGKVIQFTAPVKSIDKDFMDSAVLKFSTGEMFDDLQANLKDSDKAAAAQLSQGEVVTVRCESIRRIIDSPIGDDCTFVIGDESEQTGSDRQPSAPRGQDTVSEQVPVIAAPQAAASAPSSTNTANATEPASGGSASPSSEDVEEDAAGPSFDCSKTSGPTTTTICGNSGLSELDRQMAILYHTRTNYLQDPNVREQQQAWLRDRDGCGGDVICLRQKYMARIQQLQQSGGAPGM